MHLGALVRVVALAVRGLRAVPIVRAVLIGRVARTSVVVAAGVVSRVIGPGPPVRLGGRVPVQTRLARLDGVTAMKPRVVVPGGRLPGLGMVKATGVAVGVNAMTGVTGRDPPDRLEAEPVVPVEPLVPVEPVVPVVVHAVVRTGTGCRRVRTARETERVVVLVVARAAVEARIGLARVLLIAVTTGDVLIVVMTGVAAPVIGASGRPQKRRVGPPRPMRSSRYGGWLAPWTGRGCQRRNQNRRLRNAGSTKARYEVRLGPPLLGPPRVAPRHLVIATQSPDVAGGRSMKRSQSRWSAPSARAGRHDWNGFLPRRRPRWRPIDSMMLAEV